MAVAPSETAVASKPSALRISTTVAAIISSSSITMILSFLPSLKFSRGRGPLPELCGDHFWFSKNENAGSEEYGIMAAL
jgi:hypothetical protein